MWVLGIKPMSSGRAANTLKHRVISPALSCLTCNVPKWLMYQAVKGMFQKYQNASVKIPASDWRAVAGAKCLPVNPMNSVGRPYSRPLCSVAGVNKSLSVNIAPLSPCLGLVSRVHDKPTPFSVTLRVFFLLLAYSLHMSKSPIRTAQKISSLIREDRRTSFQGDSC